MTKILLLALGGVLVWQGFKKIRAAIDGFAQGSGSENQLWEGVGLTLVGAIIFIAPML